MNSILQASSPAFCNRRQQNRNIDTEQNSEQCTCTENHELENKFCLVLLITISIVLQHGLMPQSRFNILIRMLKVQFTFNHLISITNAVTDWKWPLNIRYIWLQWILSIELTFALINTCWLKLLVLTFLKGNILYV